MRIHTGLLAGDLYEAARKARVHMFKFEEHRSRTRDRGFEVLLSGSSSRYVNDNSGNYGEHKEFAATWDEWGIFLGEIFRRDPIAHCWAYTGQEDFQIATANRFNRLTHDQQHPNHTWNAPSPRSARACMCGAMQIYDRPRVFVVPGGITKIPQGIVEVERFLANA